MKPKEIARKAGRIFVNEIPADWIYRDQEDQEDYGIDAEIELTNENGHGNGFIFKAQIKGQEEIGKDNISVSLSLNKLNYYLNKVKIPVVLTLVGISEKLIYTRTLQDDKALRKKYRKASNSNQESLSVKFDSENDLYHSPKELINSVESNFEWLRLNELNNISEKANSIINELEDSEIEKSLDKQKLLSYYLYTKKFEQLFIEGKYEELYDEANKVFSSETEKIETRLSSASYIEKIYLEELQNDYLSLNRGLFALYSTILKIVRINKAPDHLKYYAIGLNRQLKLKTLVDQDYQLYISKTTTKNDPISSWVVDYTRSQVSYQATKNVNKAIYYLSRCWRYGYINIYVEMVPRLIPKLSLFASRLHQEGLREKSSKLYKILENFADLGSEIIIKNELNDYLPDYAILYASFVHGNEARKEELISKGKKLLDQISRNDIKQNVENVFTQILQNDSGESKDLTPEEEIQWYRRRAQSMGIDVDNPDDEIGRIIAQGLEDYNPERVIKDCENLVVLHSGILGIPAKMVGLPTAGTKYLYCTKFEYLHGGWSLDEIYDGPLGGFKEKHCKGCEAKCPRPDDWKWSSEWQEEINQKHIDVIDRMGKM